MAHLIGGSTQARSEAPRCACCCRAYRRGGIQLERYSSTRSKSDSRSEVDVAISQRSANGQLACLLAFRTQVGGPSSFSLAHRPEAYWDTPESSSQLVPSRIWIPIQTDRTWAAQSGLNGLRPCRTLSGATPSSLMNDLWAGFTHSRSCPSLCRRRTPDPASDRKYWD